MIGVQVLVEVLLDHLRRADFHRYCHLTSITIEQRPSGMTWVTVS